MDVGLADCIALIDALAGAGEARLDLEKAKAAKEALEGKVVRLARRLVRDPLATDAEAITAAGRLALSTTKQMAGATK